MLNEASRTGALITMLSRLDADEMIIVDGGSTDGGAELLQQAGLRVIRSTAGRALQMNLGADSTHAEILLFLHADNEISQQHLDRIREAMADAEVAAGRFDVRLSGDGIGLRIIAFFMNLRSRISRISTGDQAMFVRRSVFEAVGGFPEQPLMEDIELSHRLKQAGKITCLRDKVTASSRRWEKHGIVATVLLMWKLRLLYWLGTDPVRLKALYQDH